jgi:2-(1,2-epoxy-1,2-dihydrophenyl)acetyl-CoA isomerase
MSFVKVGFVPDLGAFYTLPRVVGPQRARELMLSGRELDGEEALRLGIAMELLPPEQLMERARAIAQSMTHASPAVVSMIKRTLATGGPDLSVLLEMESNAQAVAAGTPAHREAVQDFLEKRPAKFQWPAKRGAAKGSVK